MPDLQAIQVKGLAQALYLRSRHFCFRTAELAEVLGRDDAGQQAKHHQDHQQFEQGEATLGDGSALHGEILQCVRAGLPCHATAVHVWLGALRHGAQQAAQCLRRS